MAELRTEENSVKIDPHVIVNARYSVPAESFFNKTDINRKRNLYSIPEKEKKSFVSHHEHGL